MNKELLAKPFAELTLVERLRTRAYIRRNNHDRKSVREGRADRVSDLLEEAAAEIEKLEGELQDLIAGEDL